MATYSKFLSLITGIQQTVDLSANTLAVLDLSLNSVSLSGTSGSTAIGDNSATYSYITPSGNTVRHALDAIDAAIGSISITPDFSDAAFRVHASGDATKKVALDVSGVSTATTRTITIPDTNVDLGEIAASRADINDLRTLSGTSDGAVDLGTFTGTTIPDSSTIKAALQSLETSVETKAADNIVIKKDGSVTYTANQPMGTHKLTGLSAGSTAGDSVRYEQAILTSGANAFGANQPMGGFKLTGLGAGSTAGDSVRYEQAILASGVNPFTADQSMGSHKLTNVTDPSSAQDAATKAYVDAVALGLKPKQAVRAASTTNVTIASALINGATMDGITLATGDRVLLKDQSAPAENGIYIVAASGAASRSTDFDSLSPIDEINGAWLPVQLGTVNAGRIYVQYGVVATLGTDAINFEFYNPIAGLIGGDMITVSGSTISVDLATASGLESSNPGNAAGQLRVKLEASNPSLKFTGSNELAVKLDAAGAITSGASGLIVGVDGSTIEINSDALRVKDAGITLAKLASNSVDENKIVSTTMSASGAITGGSGTKLAVAVDGSTIEISTNALRVKDAGITLAKLASNSVDENKIVSTTLSSTGGLTGGSGTKLAIGVDNSTIELNSNALRVKDAGITAAKLAAGVFDQSTVTGGTGSAAVVQNAPATIKTMIAGESFAADASFLVRMAITGETAGRVYKATNANAIVDGKFYAWGVAKSVAGVSAGGSIAVTMAGSATLGANDTAFNSGDVGLPVYLTTAGGFSITAPTSSLTAVWRIGTVQSTSSMLVFGQQLNGVN